MTEFEFIENVSNYLKIDKFSIAKKSHGKVPNITYAQLLSAIFRRKTIPGIASELNISIRTTNRILNEYVFSNIPKVTGKPWKARLLEIIGYKECNECNLIKQKDCFYNLPSNITTPNRSSIMYRCIDCDKLWQIKKRKFYPYIHRAANAKYRALKNDTMSISGASESRIKEIYAKCPEGYEVDHIYPLSKGGVHHEDNLCYLTKKDNIAKSNKLPYEVPDILERAIFP